MTGNLRGTGLIAQLQGSGARIMCSARVVGAYEPLDLAVRTKAGMRLVRPKALIVAAGAFEVGYPFEGWTLPGVMTTGAAQSLLRTYRVLPGREFWSPATDP